jgi:DNA polymerase III subunit delta'
MALPQLRGHQEARDSVTRAFAAGRLPQVLLITGEPGVGKQRFGLWLAELVLCSSPSGKPCGGCRPCNLVRGLTHSDLHWFVPVPRPKAGDPDRQLDEVRETLGDLLAARRENPTYSAPDGMAMHGVASARLILRTAALTTVEGGRRVIIIGDADRLVPQEASPEAANALLKFLEEPPASSLIVLTTTEPNRVLPTIRSRAVPIRLGRLSDADVDSALQLADPTLSADERRHRIATAEGSIGRALDPRGSADRRLEAGSLLEAARQGPVRFERILKQAAWQARGDFTGILDALALTLRDALRALATGASVGPVPDSLKSIREPSRFLTAIGHVGAARELASGNINPQMILASLSGQLEEALWA